MTRRRISPLVLCLFILVIMLTMPALAQQGSDTKQFQNALENRGFFLAILSSFGAGLGASLTPCVYPMVPITVSIFGAAEAKSRSRGALLSATFVLGIACLFTPMGVACAMTGKGMGSFLGNTYVVLALAGIFFALAASMFGAFEMTLPASLNNRLTTVGGIGFKGAFLAGLVMGLIAAPCTGPFLTGLLTWIAETSAKAAASGGSSTGSIALGGSAMFAFSLGLGVPFFLAGAFALNMPKGGAWMMGIKWASGVALAYMALSYLRDAPQFGVAKFIGATGTFGLVGLSLAISGLILGLIHIFAEQRKSPIAHLSKRVKLISILPAVIGTFMVISWMRKIDPILEAKASEDKLAASGKTPDGPCAGSAQIQWATELDTALAKATTDKKPVLIDFGASWCKACGELEELTWPNAGVRKEAARFAAIKIDGSDDDLPAYKKAAEKYKVKGLPVVILLDAEGNEKVRFTEFVPADKMMAALAAVK